MDVFTIDLFRHEDHAAKVKEEEIAKYYLNP